MNKGLFVALVMAMLAAVSLAGSTASAHDPEDIDTSKISAFSEATTAPAAAQNAGGGEKSPEGHFEVVDHDPLLNRGMNSALAVHGGYIYVGSRTDGSHENAGVMVVDRSDPSNLEVVGQIGPPNEGNLGETSRELRVWPEKDLLMVLNFGCSTAIHACKGGEVTVEPSIRFYDISGQNAADPKLVSEYKPSREPHEFYLWDDPNRQGRALLYMSTPSSSEDNLLVTDISGAREGEFEEVASWTANIPDDGDDNRLHSLGVSPDGTTGYLAYLGAGFLTIDTSELARGAEDPEIRQITPTENRPDWGDPGAHSAVPLFGRDYALVTDEVYGRIIPEHGCPWGWTRLIDTEDPTKPEVVSHYKLHPYNDPEFCDQATPVQDNLRSFSSHNPTLTRNLAFITWHSGGLQAVSLGNPARPTQVAEFFPEPLKNVDTEDPALTEGPGNKVAMWSYPIISDGLIYVTDIRNGLYVLKYHGPNEEEVSNIDFLEGNSNLGDALRLAGERGKAQSER